MPQADFTGFIQETLKQASAIADSNFGTVSSVSVKAGDNNQVLTDTDLQVGKHIISAIQRAYPDHNIIDEEAGVITKNSQYTWTIDPIDGTSNFAVGVPNYGIIIGLLQKEIPVAGGVALPFFKEIITAEKGGGAYCNGEKLHVTAETRLLSTLVAYSIDGHQENPDMTHAECKTLAGVILGIRNLRAAGSAFDAVMVAKGKYGAYLNRTSKIWDNVGPQIIIQEAGGIYTDFFGNPMDYSDALKKADQNFTSCMGSPELHKQLQEIIKKTNRD